MLPLLLPLSRPHWHPRHDDTPSPSLLPRPHPRRDDAPLPSPSSLARTSRLGDALTHPFSPYSYSTSTSTTSQQQQQQQHDNDPTRSALAHPSPSLIHLATTATGPGPGPLPLSPFPSQSLDLFAYKRELSRLHSPSPYKCTKAMVQRTHLCMLFHHFSSFSLAFIPHMYPWVYLRNSLGVQYVRVTHSATMTQRVSACSASSNLPAIYWHDYSILLHLFSLSLCHFVAQSLLLLIYVGNFMNKMCVWYGRMQYYPPALGDSGRLCDPCMSCTSLCGCHVVMLSCCNTAVSDCNNL